jgi:superfamily I DNA/RNA helicase
VINLLSTQNHVNKTDIVILATKRRENSVIKNYKNSEIDNFSIPKSKSINFSTIFSFKGLESPIVIMVDIDSYSNTYYQNNESLIYVGISRAKAKLIILESDKAAVERIMLSRNKYHE